ncbi:lipid asymmetry maintenance protein MlaB [Shewanella colwelliana]|uniref:STAS domain-containing protein n=1 Tax=Shewanella colwelliana TaxID=23 RepID=UPI0022AFF4E0|nr:STAS domain-containing protein [Shewanella colwelliana]MCZ4337197.1 STAS domain-containing protein [Shewanella colwelliana]
MLEFVTQGDRCKLVGELSQQAVVQHWPKVDGLIDKQVDNLDLSGLIYSDTAGIALLIHLCGLATQAGRTLTLHSAPVQLQKLIGLYDLQDFFVEEAQ